MQDKVSPINEQKPILPWSSPINGLTCVFKIERFVGFTMEVMFCHVHLFPTVVCAQLVCG